MNIEPCKSVCHECGFLYGSDQGVLTRDFIPMMKAGTLFPCHMKLKEVTGSINQGVDKYVKNSHTLKICRGYVLSMKKSGIPPLNEAWVKLYKDVEGDDTKVMSLPEAIQYHIL
jgi:hypothetical protein